MLFTFSIVDTCLTREKPISEELTQTNIVISNSSNKFISPNAISVHIYNDLNNITIKGSLHGRIFSKYTESPNFQNVFKTFSEYSEHFN